MILGVVFLLTQMRLANARNAILDKLEESTATLREMLTTQVKEEVEHAFARFLEVLNPAQSDAMQREQDSGVNVERLRRLAESFETLERRVAGGIESRPNL
jgi:uncharacterized protein with NRDE domain